MGATVHAPLRRANVREALGIYLKGPRDLDHGNRKRHGRLEVSVPCSNDHNHEHIAVLGFETVMPSSAYVHILGAIGRQHGFRPRPLLVLDHPKSRSRLSCLSERHG